MVGIHRPRWLRHFTSKSPILCLFTFRTRTCLSVLWPVIVGHNSLRFVPCYRGFLVVILGYVSTVRLFCFLGGIVSVELFEEKSCLVTLDQSHCGSSCVLLALVSLLDETKLYLVKHTFRNQCFLRNKIVWVENLKKSKQFLCSNHSLIVMSSTMCFYCPAGTRTWFSAVFSKQDSNPFSAANGSIYVFTETTCFPK